MSGDGDSGAESGATLDGVDPHSGHISASGQRTKRVGIEIGYPTGSPWTWRWVHGGLRNGGEEEEGRQNGQVHHALQCQRPALREGQHRYDDRDGQ